MSGRCIRGASLTAAMVLLSVSAGAQTSTRGETYSISRAKGPIVIDGSLTDEGWRDATRIDQWYEVNPGDNIAPTVKTTGYLVYDDKFLYAGFEFDDPAPKSIVAPYGDHDALSGSVDFAGMFLDTRNEGHTAYEFFVTAHNVQFDAITDDSSGENSSPDFFWESATRLNDHGWTLEMRIPFSSVRYKKADPQTWGIILYRNYPRDFRRQIMSAKIPRGNQCLVCYENELTGFTKLPRGGHIVAAPYFAGAQAAHPSGALGAPLVNDPFDHKIGMDMKYTPNADNAIDATIRPDFSQIESDTAQISTNQRFALFYPEKRPFFLEGVELLATPIQAVYTRTITAPDWGGRVTGKEAGINYTALVVNDAGGGSVVVPGPNSSSIAPQDFGSTVFLARARKDIKGLSFVSVLVSDRENGADGHNRVFGPDFQVRFHGSDTIVGQWLVSDTATPNRPGVNAAWTGATFTSGAGQLAWNHNTQHFDISTIYKDFGNGFRADNGFVPQVGFREEGGETGWTFRPKGILPRVRTFVNVDSQTEHDGGGIIDRTVRPGVNGDTFWSGFFIAQYQADRIRAGNTTFPRRQFQWYQRFSPSRRFTNVGVDGNLGDDVDFVNVRPGHGGQFNVAGSINATNHLVFDLIADTSWLRVVDATGGDRDLFTAHVERIRANYTFTSRSFVRLIGQYVSTDRDPSLYLSPVAAHDGFFSGSALFAYKINWQSVMFFGYGDDRTLDEQRRLQRADRQLFVKISYAFQR